MIPTTPPNGTLKHGRESSKEESLIISLQTQLALKTELCGHYETDLKARDEVVEILGKKLANLEKDDTQRKNTLRSWKKKVQELERLCRQLEERDEVSLDESKARVDLLVRAKAEADVEINASRDRIVELQEEVERLRRHVHSLQQESADKEVKIVQMMKQHSLDKEDLQGLNIALDSKQQELQLLKRKYGVKGTAGITPAQPSSKASRRRESSFFAATPLQPRPPSVISDSGTDTTDIPKKKISSAQPSNAYHRRESSFFTPTPLHPRPPSVTSDSGTDTMDTPKMKVL